MTRSPRSVLVVPGNRPERMATARFSGADALTLDLEDSVPPSEHDAARAHIAGYLAAAPPVPVSVRTVSAGDPQFAGDLEALVGPGLAGVVLPHVEEPDQVREAAARLDVLERTRGLEPESISLQPAAESANAVRRLYEILTASPRVRGTSFNGADRGDDGKLVDYAMVRAARQLTDEHREEGAR